MSYDVPPQYPIAAIVQSAQEIADADRQARDLAERTRRDIEQGTIDKGNQIGGSGQQ